MATKKELIEELFKKLNIPTSSNLFNPTNGTISKDGLFEISNGITKFKNRNSTKQDILKHINNQLGIPPQDEHIGENDQISAKFLEDVLKFLEND